MCSQDVGVEKPGAAIFERAYKEAQFWMGPLEKDEILHIGDSVEGDYCGAKAFGFQALHLDRSDNARVTVYQDWLQAPDYPGKSERDILENTVKDLSEVRAMLQRPPTAAAAAAAEPAPYISAAKRDAMKKREWEKNNLNGGQGALDAAMAKMAAAAQTSKPAPAPTAPPPRAGGAGGARGDIGAYDDRNEVDKTTMEGHVTKVGQKISEHMDVVRGELIDTATAESDVTEDVWQAEYIKAFGVPPPMEKLYDDETRSMAGWYDGDIDRQAEIQRAKAQVCPVLGLC